MRDRLHALEIARAVLVRERARLAAILADPAWVPPPETGAALRDAVARLDADLARLAREEAALHATESAGP